MIAIYATVAWLAVAVAVVYVHHRLRQADRRDELMRRLARNIAETRRYEADGARLRPVYREERVFVAPAEWHPGLDLHEAFHCDKGRA